MNNLINNNNSNKIKSSLTTMKNINKLIIIIIKTIITNGKTIYSRVNNFKKLIRDNSKNSSKIAMMRTLLIIYQNILIKIVLLIKLN